MRRSMSEAEFAQELECSFNAALRGAFYAKEMAEAEASGRITDVRYSKNLPVVAALDLGWSDAMVVVFTQHTGSEVRIIDCRTYEHTSVVDMVQDWRGLPFPIDHVILPHDAKVTDLGTGVTRRDTFHQLGCDTSIVPNQKVHEGIEQVRAMLPNTWFDKAATVTLREALSSYRSEFDEVRGVHRVTPVHDWSSHYADAVRYLALGRGAARPMDWGTRDLSRLRG